MKYLIFTLLAAMSIQISACKKSNEPIVANKTLTGKWQLSRSLLSNGGPTYWVKAKDVSYTTFNNDGTLEGTVFPDFKQYALKDSVTLTLTGDDKTKFQNYSYKIKGDSLTMSPAGPIMCIEGCAIQFIKVQ